MSRGAGIRMLLAAAAFLAAGPAARAQDGNTLSAASIPVLCYHRFGGHNAQDAYSVTPEEFAAQLEMIQAEGMTPVSLSSLAAGLKGASRLPAKPVVITVDDGYRDFNKHARPLLAAKGYAAALFVYPAFVGTKHGFSRQDLAELQAAGFEIGSHSATHAYLTRRPAGETPEARQARLQAELAGSREKLREWSGGEVLALSYPYGLWDQETAEAAQAAGHELMFTVDPGPNDAATPRYALKRTMILRGLTPGIFLSILREAPLRVGGWEPALGARVAGPLLRLTFSLDPEQSQRLKPNTLAVTRQNQALPLRFDAARGRYEITLPKPWQRGTDLLILTARDQGNRRLRDSRLVIVDPAMEAKGLTTP